MRLYAIRVNRGFVGRSIIGYDRDEKPIYQNVGINAGLVMLGALHSHDAWVRWIPRGLTATLKPCFVDNWRELVRTGAVTVLKCLKDRDSIYSELQDLSA